MEAAEKALLEQASQQDAQIKRLYEKHLILDRKSSFLCL